MVFPTRCKTCNAPRDKRIIVYLEKSQEYEEQSDIEAESESSEGHSLAEIFDELGIYCLGCRAELTGYFDSRPLEVF